MPDTLKVVIVDDEPDLCELVKENLEEDGQCAVTAVSDPAQAFSVISTTKPDVVVLDVVMPGVRGPEIVEKLHADDATKRIPIVIISGKGEMVYVKKKGTFSWMPNRADKPEGGKFPEGRGADRLAEAFSVEEYVSKPFTTELLLEVINSAIEKARKRAKAEEEREQTSSGGL